MLIGGIQKFSLIDYPGKISAIIFTQGCNFRCPYCHNPELVEPALFQRAMSSKKIFSFLEKRKGEIDAVVVTGGEPTLQKDLLNFIRKIKNMGYLVKLDTNGSNPNIIENMIDKKLVDYIAMDIKAPLQKYEEIVRAEIDTKKIEKSINLIMESGIDYEFRTTLIKPLLSTEDVLNIGKTIQGAKRYILQKFIPSKTLDREFLASTFSTDDFKFLHKKLGSYIVECIIR